MERNSFLKSRIMPDHFESDGRDGRDCGPDYPWRVITPVTVITGYVDTISRYATLRNAGPSHYHAYYIYCPCGGILRGAGAEREPGPSVPGASLSITKRRPPPSLGRSFRPSPTSPKSRYFACQDKNHPAPDVHEDPVRACPEYPKHYRNTLPLRLVTFAVTPIIVPEFSPCFSAEVIITGAKS